MTAIALLVVAPIAVVVGSFLLWGIGGALLAFGVVCGLAGVDLARPDRTE